MGVPAFFRWLTRKYPSVIIECVENKTSDTHNGKVIYDDPSLPNPNGIEFDNLYLDMNGIIHPCTHPEDKPAPKNEDEMMVAIFACINRLFSIVRPRKLLYMAIDGVAPRAKMNQQRSRRFRSAKETVEKHSEVKRIREELLAKGYVLPPAKTAREHFDSNCITPGTPFMDRLSRCLHYFIHERMNNDPAWKKIKVILSDANVPGEGEHKIMDFIRKQRVQPNHDPNTHHVLCGADADLIMLGLATHEPNFTIIREEFLPNKPHPCDICNQFGHEIDKCVGLNYSDKSSLTHTNPEIPIGAEVKYIFVRLSVLREYLKKTLDMPKLPFKYDFERVIDDWVFMCFFVGNDFLPHLPSLEIREGAIDRLVELYKKCVYKTGGYLTNSGDVNLERVQLIMTDLGNIEDQIFQERQSRELQFKARDRLKRLKEQETVVRNNQHNSSRPTKRTASDADLDNQDNDEVRLWDDGFKDRYYESKFDVGPENQAFRYSVALQYVRGLCWVLKYYYQGCASWNWYFPYHYAPFASDFFNITGLSTAFDLNTKPFNPLEQLMSVFPAASCSHVPKPWAELMFDAESPIIDFYPEDFKIDLNGKKFAWQGVALLPFVDEQRLFEALRPHYKKLSSEEVQRNEKGDCRLYIGRLNSQFQFMKQLCSPKSCDEKQTSITLEGMTGTVLTARNCVAQFGSLKSPICTLSDIVNNEVLTICFRDPVYKDNFKFPAMRLPNAMDPPKVLISDVEVHNYRPMIGFNRNMPRAYVTTGGHRMLNTIIGGGSVQGNAGLSRDRSEFMQNQNNDGQSYHNHNNMYGFNMPGHNQQNIYHHRQNNKNLNLKYN